jgi:hypothetical protein
MTAATLVSQQAPSSCRVLPLSFSVLIDAPEQLVSSRVDGMLL